MSVKIEKTFDTTSSKEEINNLKRERDIALQEVDDIANATKRAIRKVISSGVLLIVYNNIVLNV